jgi:hypothetical protein
MARCVVAGLPLQQLDHSPVAGTDHVNVETNGGDEEQIRFPDPGEGFVGLDGDADLELHRLAIL